MVVRAGKMLLMQKKEETEREIEKGCRITTVLQRGKGGYRLTCVREAVCLWCRFPGKTKVVQTRVYTSDQGYPNLTPESTKIRPQGTDMFRTKVVDAGAASKGP